MPSAREGRTITRASRSRFLISCTFSGARTSSRSAYGISKSPGGPTTTQRAAGRLWATTFQARCSTSAPFLSPISPANTTSSSVSPALEDRSSIGTGFGSTVAYVPGAARRTSSRASGSRHVIASAHLSTLEASRGRRRANSTKSAPWIEMTILRRRRRARQTNEPSLMKEPRSERCMCAIADLGIRNIWNAAFRVSKAFSRLEPGIQVGCTTTSSAPTRCSCITRITLPMPPT